MSLNIRLLAIVTIWELRSSWPELYGETASLVSPTIPKSFEIVSKHFAAVICDAEAHLLCEYCSVSFFVFDDVHPEHNSLLLLLEVLRKFGVLQVTEVHHVRTFLRLTN